MKKSAIYLTLALILSSSILFSCSRSQEPSQAKEGNQSSTEQAIGAIKEYGNKPIQKARSAQQIGDERTNAIDEAVKQK